MCPHACAVKDEGGLSGDLSDLMNDRELFKAFDLTAGLQGRAAGCMAGCMDRSGGGCV